MISAFIGGSIFATEEGEPQQLVMNGQQSNLQITQQASTYYSTDWKETARKRDQKLDLKQQQITTKATEKNGKRSWSRWTDLEHSKFLEASKLYEDDIKQIAKYIGTRSRSQILTHKSWTLKKCKAEPNSQESKDFMVVYKRLKTFWNEEEHKKFITAVRIFGKCWSKVSKFVSSRNYQQCKNHGQVFIIRIQANPNIYGADVLPVLEQKAKKLRNEYRCPLYIANNADQV